jgi:DNA-binding transcriptional MerR regulator
MVRIGELSRLTGLPVRTIRFWSDEGLVPPEGRTPAGYRLYGPDALVRLGLVRTLRGSCSTRTRRWPGRVPMPRCWASAT